MISNSNTGRFVLFKKHGKELPSNYTNFYFTGQADQLLCDFFEQFTLSEIFIFTHLAFDTNIQTLQSLRSHFASSLSSDWKSVVYETVTPEDLFYLRSMEKNYRAIIPTFISLAKPISYSAISLSNLL